MLNLWKNSAAIALVLAMPGGLWADDRREAVPLEQAIGCLRAAVAARPGQVKELDIAREGNRLVCEVDIVNGGNEFEVKVDVRTGKVLRVKQD